MQSSLSTAGAALQKIEAGSLNPNRELQRFKANAISQKPFPQSDTFVLHLHYLVAVRANDMKRRRRLFTINLVIPVLAVELDISDQPAV